MANLNLKRRPGAQDTLNRVRKKEDAHKRVSNGPLQNIAHKINGLEHKTYKNGGKGGFTMDWSSRGRFLQRSQALISEKKNGTILMSSEEKMSIKIGDNGESNPG